jgi:hypothetical protein
MEAYVYNADIFCHDCGVRTIRQLIREGKAPNIKCLCGFNEKVGPRRARSAFEKRDSAEWLLCPKCETNRAVFDDQDSTSWPQAADDGGGEADSVQHCGSGEDCLNPCEVDHEGMTTKVGAILGNPLTSEGVADLIRMVSDPKASPYQKALHDCWKGVYDYIDFPDPICAKCEGTGWIWVMGNHYEDCPEGCEKNEDLFQEKHGAR